MGFDVINHELSLPDYIAIGPPVNVGVDRSSVGGVVITWDPPQTEEVLLGYKINVGRAEPIHQIALYSTDVDTRRFFVTPSIFTEYGEEVIVIVWAYSLDTDGKPVKVVVSPFGEIIGTSAGCPHSRLSDDIVISCFLDTVRLEGLAPHE